MSREPRHSYLRDVAIEALLLFDAVDHGHGDTDFVNLAGHSRLRAACEVLVACDPSVWPAVQVAAELIGEELAPGVAVRRPGTP